MKAWRLALSAIRLLRIEGCPIPAVNSARVSVLEMQKHQLLVGAALVRQYLDVYQGDVIITCYD